MSNAGNRKQPLVQETANRLRELSLASEPGARLGSLAEMAGQFDVGIVTVQQAARILEHEGLLKVKRGPGGGYSAARPDDAALERAFATYMRVHDINHREAFELAVMLDCEIIQTAAREIDESALPQIHSLLARLDTCADIEDCVDFEIRFRETLLGLFEQPLLELLAKVAMQMYREEGQSPMFEGDFDFEGWRIGRRRILEAILARDGELAGFEAQRYRQMAQGWLKG
ncbi:FadR/GntR family transcriptional regulator [Haliea sp. E17]|uniref:FadR/GntR family transcriptional regulator n=1 Tax=Haliea sp. E17 TaxID=3401576 RepID=UPI003AADC39B